MKEGLTVGHTSKVDIEVTPDMIACFEGKTVHRLYSTSFLVQHMELSCRKLIEPYLEANEEAMGVQFDVSHLALTLPGMTVSIRATVSDIRDNKVVAEVEASNIRGKIAKATVTQAVVDKDWLDKRMKELAIIQNIASDQVVQSTTTQTTFK